MFWLFHEKDFANCARFLKIDRTYFQQIQTTPPQWRDLVKTFPRKLWHTSSFLLECTDFKNVFFEKIPWAHSEVAEVTEVKQPRIQNNENYKWKLLKIRCNPKFGLGDLENDLLTSVTSEGAQWIFSKITFLKSVHQAEKNELLLGFLFRLLQIPLFNSLSSEATKK